MEAEVRAILSETLARPPATDRLGTRIHQRFAEVGGPEIELPVRAERPRRDAAGMIVLDTNVVSELMRPQADPSVVGWVDRQARPTSG